MDNLKSVVFPVFLVVAIISMFILLGIILNREDARRLAKWRADINNARTLVVEWADRLEAQRKTGGGLAHFNNLRLGDIPATDPWNNNLRYEYYSGNLSEYLQVRSLGPDRSSETPDDIIETRTVEVIRISE